jgi:beta-lactamase regulating signal transducer with metallopeptidase domain
MSETFDQFLLFARQSALGLLDWSWQAVVLLACVWLMLQIRRTKAPARRHQIWLGGLIAIALLPLYTPLLRQIPRPTLAGSASSILAPLGVESLPDLPTQILADATLVETMDRFSFIPSLLFAAWLLGILLMLIRLAGRQIRWRRMLAEARPATLVELGCAEIEIRGRRLPSLRLSTTAASPVLCGVLRPVIVLPADIVEWTTPAERAAMICHELAHLERGDSRINLFQTLLRTVFFFHPLVRYACRQLCLERELACDDRVVGTGTAPEVYAAGILKVAERSLAPGGAPQLALLSNKKMLERRLDMILNPERKRILIAQRRSLIFPLALLMVIGGLLVPGPVGSASGAAAGGIPVVNMVNQAEDDEQALLGLFRRFSEAAARGDFSLAKEVGLGDALRTEDGRTFMVIKGSKLDNIELLQFDVENAKAYIKGDTAALSYKVNMRLKRPTEAQAISLTGTFTNRFIKRDGQWQAVSLNRRVTPNK